MALATDVTKLLSDNGFGQVGQNIFSYKWGKRSDNQILVVPTGGEPSPLKEVYRNPTFQILVRGKRNSDHNANFELAERIYSFLVNLGENIEVNGCSYKGFDPVSDIGVLGEDENERPVCSMNFETYI